ncbi:MAG: S9 family peptidase, partial [Candidatus Bathyarchaeota archaeon]|nr:S9 family peptidase [Candidatus Bathyarchaeota archaeon]
MSKVSPYGSWKSPITSDMVAQSTVGLGQVEIEDKTVYWIEMRPAEQGRCVIVKHPRDGKTVDVNPP